MEASAVSHVHVLERLTTPYGPFSLVEVKIETGRTHQIRVHVQALGHPVVGDFLYGAPHVVKRLDGQGGLELDRNFLHAARLEFVHPRTGKDVAAEAPLAEELVEFLEEGAGFDMGWQGLYSQVNSRRSWEVTWGTRRIGGRCGVLE